MTFKQRFCKHSYERIGWKNGFNISGSDTCVYRCSKCDTTKEEIVNLAEKYNISKESLLTKGEKILQEKKEEEEKNLNTKEYGFLFEEICDQLNTNSTAESYAKNKKIEITINLYSSIYTSLHKICNGIACFSMKNNLNVTSDKNFAPVITFLQSLGWEATIEFSHNDWYNYFLTIEVM